jgi:D-3-phosphoglycerate dehydrogenase
MAANQLVGFLELGNIKNAVNFPDCELDMLSGTKRIVVANRNIPNMVGQISTILAAESINIADMINRHKGDYAYNIIDVEGDVRPQLVERLRTIDGVIMVREIDPSAEEALQEK